jgi:hypothetical protein
VMGVKRVVEVEHPCLDMGEAALFGGCIHGGASSRDRRRYPPGKGREARSS